MRIVIANVQAPFIFGGAELLAQELTRALQSAGHQAEIVTFPFFDSPLSHVENHVLAARLLDVQGTWAGKTDLCVGLKFPAYCIPHENKVSFVLHQYRAAYERYGQEEGGLPDTSLGREVRKIVYNADNSYLRESKRVYTISKNVSGRMWKFNQIASTPLYHPCPDMDKFYDGPYGDYILMPSRVTSDKRQMLAVEAMRHTKSNLKLYIVGKADNETDREELLDRIDMYKLKDRVLYMDFVPQAEKLSLYANACAVLFIPKDEDYGYITLEALAASKAVITATDSGGPMEFIQNDKSGTICDPDAIEIAKAIDSFASTAKAEALGCAGKRVLQEMDISWTHVVKELTKA